ncbi:mRNA interferase RelE/StbE [Halobacillus alkaliphilus]|uniref:mRNA interferase RelE/StbE n=1 Tax=Halobacillus alkaliphilus TaxID=396056 RepID=A0A1I2JWC6_9BACI|nr:type II toxin-antitoxin system RelE/ParE family toxin [Halobacillus alkaliphilus]SFF58433.1 mRNA interferase RelE/StbE [Halobacillus alkaliphilus]
MYEILLSKGAEKFVRKQDVPTKKRIKKALLDLAEDPHNNILDTKKLSTGDMRLRVGKFRVIYELDNENIIIHVLDIGSRGQVYK